MRLTIRVGNTLADLEQINRVGVETIGGFTFLVGIRHSGRRIALFVVKDSPDAGGLVMDDITRIMNANRRVCDLTDVLEDIAGRPDAEAALEKANAETEAEREAARGDTERPNVGKGHLTGSIADA